MKKEQSLPLEYRQCTDEDMTKFNTFSPNDALLIDRIRQEQALLCIDPTEPLLIRGESEIDAVDINIDLKVCDPKRNKCSHRSLKDVQNYFKHPELLMVYNEVSFDKQVYGEQKYINRFAKLFFQHIDTSHANWGMARIINNVV